MLGLPAIALAHPLQQGEIALIFIAIVSFASGRGRGLNVEKHGQRGHRQKALHVFEPCRVESLRFTVGNARRAVPIADQNQSSLYAFENGVAPLVPVRDEQKLHHIRTVLALAGKRTSDLFANGRSVIRKGHQPDLAPHFAQAIAEQLRLGLFAALVQTFEGDQRAGDGGYIHASGASRLSMSSIVWRRRTTRAFPLSTSTSAASGRRL